MKNTKIIGHRGAAGTHPENTMISFKEAERVGAHGIELDVHLSKDHQLVVIHDDKVDRTTDGKGWVKDLKVNELKKLDASYKFKGKYGICPIPTLEEVFSWARKTNLVINVEFKNSLIDYPDMEKKTIDLIYQYKMNKRVFLSSFNHESMVKANAIDPSIEAAILYMEKMYEPWEYVKQLGLRAVHPYHRTVRDDIVKACHEHGVSIRPFTINDKAIMKKMISYSCDAIITDFPDRALKLIK
ncbi:glycerophosphodiester phosphodiesterase [Bacillus sp. PS06]|uniref:glycerophosphodiester phosphodiesterase n=1 Tax=Bacillus sp. PS06 TaxID=2764176 RepID=UPI0017849647|nr:glycerophosphodiester phosphodiesterase [Bacillus sp. PS06]MBD8070387.1 glycerophosphodiester phosphodiesterase [Bacillus sp. PS06]